MKRILCSLLLVISLLAFSLPAMADDETVSYKTVILPIIDMSPMEWCKSSDTRALFTVIAGIEYSAWGDSKYDITDSLLNTSFVLRKDFNIMTAIQLADDSWMVIGYNPLGDNQTVMYSHFPDNSKTAMRLILSQASDEIYENSLIDIYSAYMDLKDMFNIN